MDRWTNVMLGYPTRHVALTLGPSPSGDVERYGLARRPDSRGSNRVEPLHHV